ncbi:helix-turn-helix domain-containing protein [Streptomyces sp. NPDC087532]|uniref:helix-turn-helix domain-containing protein n=1 Tax=Streptomyces sp. NPDC087532 TaxID=3365795 RepID=UPI00382D1E86
MAVSKDRSVTLCRILLGLQLRRLREARGLKAAAVAQRFGWSTARMTRLETKDTAVEVGDVRLLCDLYEASRELRDELENYALITKTQKGWWETKPFKETVPAWFMACLGLEAAATEIRIYQSEFVPGLVQDPGYAKAILGLSDADDQTIERHAEVRSKRQSILTRQDFAPNVTVILNEAVIRRPVGGAGIMRQQLHRILDLAERPNITVQILPFSAGAHPAMNGPFTIWGFDDDTVGDLAFLENLVDGGVVTNAELVGPFIGAFGQLERLAATEGDSVTAIRAAAAVL